MYYKTYPVQLFKHTLHKTYPVNIRYTNLNVILKMEAWAQSVSKVLVAYEQGS